MTVYIKLSTITQNDIILGASVNCLESGLYIRHVGPKVLVYYYIVPNKKEFWMHIILTITVFTVFKEFLLAVNFLVTGPA